MASPFTPTTIPGAGVTLPVSLAEGGTAAALTDPGGDRILFWDDSAGVVTWLQASTGLTITTTAMTAAGSIDGWIASGETWTYASASTFTVAGVDVTAKYAKGTRIKLTQTTAKYFVVVASAFGTDTTVTVTGGTDYTLANAAITSPFYSYEASPQGYPGWFAYTPTVVGLVTPTIGYARFSVIGRLCVLKFNISGTSNTTGFTFTLPVDLHASGIVLRWNVALIADNGTDQAAPGHARGGDANATTITLYRTATNGTWTASGSKYAIGVIEYEI